jgi:hypothetical protein
MEQIYNNKINLPDLSDLSDFDEIEPLDDSEELVQDSRKLSNENLNTNSIFIKVFEMSGVSSLILGFLDPNGPDLVGLRGTNKKLMKIVENYCVDNFDSKSLMLYYERFIFSLPILQYYWDKTKNYFCSTNILKNYAIQTGKIEILQWCLFNDCCKITISDFEKAADCGNMEIIMWFYNVTLNFPYDSICKHAAIYGHLHIIKWFHLKGCVMSRCVFVNAIIGSHINILYWGIKNNYDYLFDDIFCNFALASGKNEVIVFINRFKKIHNNVWTRSNHY